MSEFPFDNVTEERVFKPETKLAPLISSACAEWGTPQWLFDKLNAAFKFTLDPCASEANHKCDRYYTEETNGLAQPWSGRVFMDPPYGPLGEGSLVAQHPAPRRAGTRAFLQI